MEKSILTVDINVSELDEFKQMVKLNLELRNVLRGLIEAHAHTYGLDGAGDSEVKAAEAALAKADGEV